MWGSPISVQAGDRSNILSPLCPLPAPFPPRMTGVPSLKTTQTFSPEVLFVGWPMTSLNQDYHIEDK